MKKINKLLLILTLFILILLSVGYSSYSSVLSINNLAAFVRINKDIRITKLSVESSNSGGVSYYEDYNVSRISSNVYLPNSNSSVTYKITVTNIDGPEMGIYSINGLPENLDYTISNYILKDKICDSNNNCSLGISKDIYLTIKYKNYDPSNKEYNLTLDFDFREVHSITYENVDASLYRNEVLNGDKLEVDFGTNIVHCVIKDSNGNELAGNGTYYEFSNGKLIIYSVTDNLIISVSDTAPLPTLISTIRNLYLNAQKRTVTDGEASYYYADSVQLMNDGLDTNGDITYDETKGNIRYFGYDYYSVNNYIYFNCDDYSDTSTCETWRIIGIVDGKVKIINTSGIGNFSWDYNYNDNQLLGSGYEANWNTSSLNKLLNGAYYNNLDTTYYNYSDGSHSLGGGGGFIPEPDDDFGDEDLGSSGDSNGEYPEEISYETWFNYRGNGITEATRTNNLILDAEWHINKVLYEEYSMPVFTIYQQEQQGAMTFTGRIGLPDLSDVLFSDEYFSYSSWLGYKIEEGWTLTTQDDNYVHYISERGPTTVEPIHRGYFGPPIVLPTLYLSTKIVVDPATDGSESNPYKLIVG